MNKNRNVTSERIYKSLKNSIIGGDEYFKEGSQIIETEIANKFGVSRTPVREALIRLAAEEFIKIFPNQGAFINKFSLKDLKEILEIRSVLLGLASKLAIKKITDKEIEKLELIINKMEEYVETNNIKKYSVCANEAHNFIVDIADNVRIKKILSNFNNFTILFQLTSLYVPGRLKTSLNEHKNIVKAIKNGDIQKAEKLSQKHIINTFINIVKAIPNIK